MPGALRELFAVILLNSNPSDIRALWEEFYSDFSEDVTHQNPLLSETVVLDIVCAKLSEIFSRNNRRWSDFPGLPSYNATVAGNQLIQEEKSYDREELLRVVSGESSFTELQRCAYEKVVHSVETQRGNF
jgi:hypothetical protein